MEMCDLRQLAHTDTIRRVRRYALRIVLVVALAVSTAFLWSQSRSEQAPIPPNAMRVLFVGNSHTFINGMPEMVVKLAAKADVDRPLHYVMEAPGGAGFVEHLDNGHVETLLGQGPWDFVVLQDQQQRPSFTFDPERADRWFFTPARALDAIIQDAGTKTILFMTWARQAGDPDNVEGDTFDMMQARVSDAYDTLALEVGATVAPVGLAWQAAHHERPELVLWRPDGSHAQVAGSYLAASVLFATIYEQSPLSNSYTAGLSSEDARFLQRTAEASLSLTRTPSK